MIISFHFQLVFYSFHHYRCIVNYKLVFDYHPLMYYSPWIMLIYLIDHYWLMIVLQWFPPPLLELMHLMWWRSPTLSKSVVLEPCDASDVLSSNSLCSSISLHRKKATKLFIISQFIIFLLIIHYFLLLFHH